MPRASDETAKIVNPGAMRRRRRAKRMSPRSEVMAGVIIRHHSMRKSVRWAAATVVAVAAVSVSCSSPARRGPSKYSQKLVILGFDGMDPHLLEKWMSEGKLPNISALARQGGFSPLQTTHSPESPTAWASFATSVNAGKHNIYDFLVRDTTTYLPDLGMVTRTPAKFLFGYVPIAKPQLHSIRGGTSFWVTAGKDGVR